MKKSLRIQILASDKAELPLLLTAATHQLTVAARSAYGTDDMATRLRVVNELVHQLSSKQRALLDMKDEALSYPMDVFLDILSDIAGTDWSEELDWAFQFALESRRKPLKA